MAGCSVTLCWVQLPLGSHCDSTSRISWHFSRHLDCFGVLLSSPPWNSQLFLTRVMLSHTLIPSFNLQQCWETQGCPIGFHQIQALIWIPPHCLVCWSLIRCPIQTQHKKMLVIMPIYPSYWFKKKNTEGYRPQIEYVTASPPTDCSQ